MMARRVFDRGRRAPATERQGRGYETAQVRDSSAPLIMRPVKPLGRIEKEVWGWRNTVYVVFLEHAWG